jgi:hypothetical protein
MGAPSLTRGRVCHLSQLVIRSVVSIYIHKQKQCTGNLAIIYIQYLQGLCQSRLSTADYALLLSLQRQSRHLSGRAISGIPLRVFISVNTTSVQIRCTFVIYYMFRSFGHHIHSWLHCSPITLANILCCWFHILWCNCIATYLLRVRTVEPEKKQLLGNSRKQQ